MRTALVLLCACKIGFDARIATDGNAIDTSTADAAAFDSAPDTPPGTMTITFGERPSSQRKNVTVDTSIVSMMATQNFGGGESVSLEEFNNSKGRGLLRFDLTSLAAGTVVVAARLKLATIDYGDETAGAIIVRLATESWVEGNGDGMVVPGANWNTRDGTIAWTTIGGSPGMMLATLTPPAAQFTIDLPAATVQGWFDAPATNFGVVLGVVAEPAHYHFHQASSPTAALRPELELVVQ